MDISQIILSGNFYKCHNQIMSEELNYYNKHVKEKQILQNIGLHNINDSNILKLFLNIDKTNIIPITSYLDKLDDETKKNIIVTGGGIRSILATNIANFKKEYNIHIICKIDSEFDDIRKQINLPNNYQVNFLKTHSVGAAIYNNDFIKRLGYHNGDVFVTSMFLVEYHKNIWAFTNDLVDPIFKIPQDVLDIYDLDIYKGSKIKNIIETANIERLISINRDILKKEYINGKTLIEFAIKCYIDEKHPIIKEHRKNIILHLNSEQYIRPAFLYGKFINLDKSDMDIFNVLVSCENMYNLKYDKYYTPTSMEDIDSYLIIHIILLDNHLLLHNFLKFSDYFKTAKKNNIKKIIELLITKKPKDIIKYIIDNNKLNESYIYQLILLSEDFSLLNSFTKFDVDIAINYFEDIIKRGLMRSFYYIIKKDPSALDIKFADDNNILHICENLHESVELIKLVLQINKKLLNQQNINKKTPLMIQAEKGFGENVLQLLEAGADMNIVDLNGETFLHKIAREGHIELLKSIRLFDECINIKNNNLETPIMVACIKGNEEIFYILKDKNAELMAKDIYGNTVYHYICLNGICIGTIIMNNPNKFGFLPQDYCRIAPEYYNFIK
jgi:hypothetical protein